MKKIYALILAVVCFAVVTKAQVTVAITHINDMSKADYLSTYSGLTEGETLKFTISYKNVVADNTGVVRLRVRVLNNYTPLKDGNGVDLPEAILNVTTSSELQTAEVNYMIPNVEEDIAQARLQAIAYGEKADETMGNIYSYVGPFTLNDLIPTAINNLKKGLSNTYYVASKDAIVVGDDVNGEYSIYNLSGQLVLNGTVESQINVSALSSGMYILSCNGGVLKFAK